MYIVWKEDIEILCSLMDIQYKTLQISDHQTAHPNAHQGHRLFLEYNHCLSLEDEPTSFSAHLNFVSLVDIT